MSQFTQPFVGELVGKNTWKVYVAFEYHVGTYPSKQIIYIPVGFITDFASIPRIFWPFISPIDEHGKAAVIHDYMYTVRYDKKSVCDKIYLEALTVLKVPEWKKSLLYNGVKYFGWYRWTKCRLKDKGKIF